MRHMFVAVYIYEHTFPSFSRHFFLLGLCPRTNIRTARSYLFIYFSVLPSNCLSVQHTSLQSVHFTAPSYRLTASLPCDSSWYIHHTS
jgi:hypothetical protein